MKDNLVTRPTIKDHGIREEMSTGSRRDTQDGKPRYDLMPLCELLEEVMIYTNGAEKYGDNNWMKGQPIMRYFTSAMRHLCMGIAGMKDEPHLHQAIWNIRCINWTLKRIERGLLPSELDDRDPVEMEMYREMMQTILDDVNERAEERCENR